MATQITPHDFESMAGLLVAVSKITGPRILSGPHPPAGWDAYAKQISEFITANKIPSLAQKYEQMIGRGESLGVFESVLDWQGKAGGWPGLHLHYSGQMYPLTNAQWESFSKPLVKQLAAKLNEANTITFEQFTALG
ncbi:MAG: hypothetical protein ABSG62_14285 [Terracidiphilus sp.]|jgi:hypothetical protein